jgi:hypothetical protein
MNVGALRVLLPPRPHFAARPLDMTERTGSLIARAEPGGE